ncbi:hypothetical protein Q4O60_12760 [Aeribacillus pallidus]|nr:hypothetical protein [Aeribacillus pallidus]
MKKVLIISGIFILVAGFFGVNLVYKNSNKAINVDVIKLKEKPLVETIMIPGILHFKDHQYGLDLVSGGSTLWSIVGAVAGISGAGLIAVVGIVAIRVVIQNSGRKYAIAW